MYTLWELLLFLHGRWIAAIERIKLMGLGAKTIYFTGKYLHASFFSRMEQYVCHHCNRNMRQPINGRPDADGQALVSHTQPTLNPPTTRRTDRSQDFPNYALSPTRGLGNLAFSLADVP